MGHHCNWELDTHCRAFLLGLSSSTAADGHVLSCVQSSGPSSSAFWLQTAVEMTLHSGESILRGVGEELKDKLAAQDETPDFESLITLRTNLDNCLRERRRVKSKFSRLFLLFHEQS